MPRDYKETCLLPKTAFAMKADLYQREPQWLARWKEQGLYDKILARPVPGRFVFHDGPPYANGHMHYGHILNNALKDFVTRSRNLLGERTRFIPGWDCHGLPIELNVDREVKRRNERVTPSELRARCRAEATTWVNVQREERARLGVLGTWETPYLTMDPLFEAQVIRALRAFVAHGLVYRGKKPVQWCWHCRTALAEAEVEYRDDHVSPSVYVKFALNHASAARVRELTGATAENLYAVIWTTTPWTLAANLAIAIHPELEYVVLDAGNNEGWLVAKPLAESVAKAAGLATVSVSRAVLGGELSGLLARHPFEDRASPLLLADHVEDTAGTGLVHTAPGHGRDDYRLGAQHGLEAYAPVGDDGRYNAELGAGARAMGLEGLFVFDANPVVEKALVAHHALANAPGKTVTHKYPICWRCKNPLITRATTQWFIALDEPMQGDGERGATLRHKALGEIDRLAAEGAIAERAHGAAGWIPAWGKERIRGMIEQRPDWCISRQRVWGVPIPAVHCGGCGHAFLTTGLLDHVADVFATRGADAWYTDDADVLPADLACPECHAHGPFTRDANILDVWFESGSSFYAVCAPQPDLGPIVDLYLEGSDQHRGWFHSSLLVGCAVLGRAPYQAVLTHGFVCDENGRPYSKSEIRRRQEAVRDTVLDRVAKGEKVGDVAKALGQKLPGDRAAELAKVAQKKGNPEQVATGIAEFLEEYIAPEKIIAEQGAELFRAWVAFVDYENDMPYSRNLLSQAVDAYRRVRNTLRFMLGALREEPAPLPHQVTLEPADRWALARLREVLARCASGYRRYQFREVFSTVHDFTQELSAFYLDASKDWLYNDAADSVRRTSARATMQFVTRALASAIAPILPFSAEDVWDHLPAFEGKTESVHLAAWPEVAPADDEPQLLAAMRRVRSVRDAVNGALEPLVQAWGVEKQSSKKAGREPGTGDKTFADEARIDHARDARVDLTLPAGDRAELHAFGDRMADVLGLGEVMLITGDAVHVTARRAPGAPCDRCWKRRPDVRAHGLCPRCEEAVRVYDAGRPPAVGEGVNGKSQ